MNYTLIAFIILLIGSVAFAQNHTALRFEAITIDDGLSQGFVSGVLQDKRGVMWFVTRDGLNKYDGSTITSYTHDPDDSTSIGSNFLESIFEDAQGRLWIGTRDKGLDLFDRQQNKFYHIRHTDASSIRSNRVLKITEDKTGALWVQTGKGVDRLHILKKNYSSLATTHPLTNATVQITHIEVSDAYNVVRENLGPEKICIDSRGRVLITTNQAIWEVIYTASTNRYRVEKRYSFPAKELPITPELLEDTIQHRLYVNTGSIIQFSNYDFTAERVLLKNSFFPWVLDRQNRLWVCDKKNLLQLNVSSGELTQITVDNPLHQSAFNTPFCFYVDRSGVLWMGTGGYGLLKYDPTKELFHHVLPGQSLYQLHALSADRLITDKLQVLTLKKGQSAVVSESPYQKLLRQEVPAIYSFAKDTLENIWIANTDYLINYSLNVNKLHKYPLPTGRKGIYPYPLVADRQHNIWMGYDEYLLKFSPSTATFEKYLFPVKSTIYQNNFLQTIYEDNGVLWLGLSEGLMKFSLTQKRFLDYYTYKAGDSTSLSYNFIYSICTDPRLPQNYLWIGTNGGGLNQLDKRTGKFIRFNTKRGLPSNVVYGIVPDRRGHLWLSTNRGIAEFDPITKQFKNYTANDGLQSNEFNRFSYGKTNDGLLVFGGVNGLNYFDPATISEFPPPTVVFTQFRLFNKAVTNRQPNSPLQKDIGYTDEIKLQYNQNVLTFRFAATDYRRVGSITYRYKLEGFQDNWNYAGSAQEATFTNLDPGNYRFVVQASFDNRIWGSQVSALRLWVSTPWWASWWFYGLVTLATVSALYGLYRYRLAQVLKLQHLRNHIARDLHDEVGSSISSVAIYSKALLGQLGQSTDKNEALLQKISEQASEIMESMNDIVWSINTKNDSFEQIISRMREHAYQFLEAKGYVLHFEFDENLPRLKLEMGKRREFYLIYKEALNNIAKYANGQNAWITLQVKESTLLMTIRDDGQGFDPVAISSRSNGLANMTHRAASLNGQLRITSTLGKGTLLELRF